MAFLYAVLNNNTNIKQMILRITWIDTPIDQVHLGAVGMFQGYAIYVHTALRVTAVGPFLSRRSSSETLFFGASWAPIPSRSQRVQLQYHSGIIVEIPYKGMASILRPNTIMAI